jgi:hypothetical protein
MEQLEKHPPLNPNQVTAVIKIINSLPKTPLFYDLKLLAESLNKPLLKPLIERLAQRYAHTVTVTKQVSVTETAAEKAKAPQKIAEPVDNSPSAPQPPPVKNAFLKEMEKEFSAVMAKIKSRYDYKQQQQIENWLKANYRGKHPQALIHTLNALAKTPDQVRDIPSYLDKIIIMENQNYNYADFQKKAEEFKKPGILSLGDIFTGISLLSAARTT